MSTYVPPPVFSRTIRTSKHLKATICLAKKKTKKQTNKQMEKILNYVTVNDLIHNYTCKHLKSTPYFY